ncbi:hypothetical protein [Sinomonas halotolerans]|uniref:MmpS family membrane protein n=1 Tax=Sinomonas halotolerans TaxID=1644133 RepID=A0ABU9X0G1_9MICC
MDSPSTPPVAIRPSGPETKPPLKPGRTLAVVSLVFGAVALLTAWVPLVNVAGMGLAAAGAVCGGIALARRSGARGLARAGLAVCLASIPMAYTVNQTAARVISESNAQFEKSMATFKAKAKAQRTVEFRVTTNAPAVVSYLGGDGSQRTRITEDWSTEFTETGMLISMLDVVADPAAKSAKVSCEIIIDGQSVSKETGTAPYASASCYGSDSDGPLHVPE